MTQTISAFFLTQRWFLFNLELTHKSDPIEQTTGAFYIE